MTKNSLRERIRSLKVGEQLIIPRTEYLPSVARQTTYNIAFDYPMKFRTSKLPEGVRIERVS